ncbi:unnamed protein product [Caenorhabditis bovis]|uniref:Uncharacterized protein n=1 Tax=Caenorhabditis bovis TaxID=2654633 RepID=A0A8S1ESV6_9PELO|nr:unnamed protein product [Caenorhabditis bovis]
MADDNVSFTDAAETGAGGGAKGGGNSAMLDLMGALNKGEAASTKGKKGKKAKKGKGGGGGKKKRKADRFESQNFLFRIEGTIFFASIIVGCVILLTFLIAGFVFSITTGGVLVYYVQPWFS